MRAMRRTLRSPSVQLFLLASLAFLVLSACGNGNMLGNGTGSVGTAAGALQVANADIAQGNYSGAISVLSPYCPNNNCVSADVANAYANAYTASGNASVGASVTGVSAVSASQAGATTTQILSTVLTLVNSQASGMQVIQGIDQAIPCLANNTCSTTYLDNLATALQALANTTCSGSSSVATNCPDSSSILLTSAIYILVVAQYETGIVYDGGWHVCSSHGAGLTGCSALSTVSESTLKTDLTGTSNALKRLQNIITILGATYAGGSATGTTATITDPNATAINALPYFLSSLGSVNSNIINSFYEILNALSTCSSSGGTTCSQNPSGSYTGIPSINETGIAYYLDQL